MVTSIAAAKKVTGSAAKKVTESVGVVDAQYLDLPRPLRLDCGRELQQVRVAYETYGTLNPRHNNVILVCHTLSGDAHAAGIASKPPEEGTRDGFAAEERDGRTAKALGWWDGMIGPGKAFDTDRFFVVSTNLLGGCRGTTGPSSLDPATGHPYGARFPVITVADMVRAECALLDELGIDRLAAVAGGSLGGMQALEWAILFPDQVDAVVAIASTHALHPQGLAWNSIAREAIIARPRLAMRRLLRLRPRARRRNGRGPHGRPHDVPLGRGAGREVRPAPPVRRRGPLYDHRAGVRDRKLPPASGRLVRQAFRCEHVPLHITRLDIFRPRSPARRRVAGTALEGVSARVLLIAFSSDWLYPPAASRDIERTLLALGKPVECHVIEAPYGHDCFLLEEAHQTPYIRRFLADDGDGG